MTAVEPSGRREAAGLTLTVAVMTLLFGAYVAFYVYVPIDSTIRLVAVFGMLVFLLVVLAVLLLFTRWWSGTGRAR